MFAEGAVTPAVGQTPDSLLAAVLSLGPSPSLPIAIGRVGDHYTCLYFDHGIGDAHVMAEILATLSHAGTGRGYVDPAPVALTNAPFCWALLGALRSPTRCVSALRRTWDMRRQPSPPNALPGVHTERTVPVLPGGSMAVERADETRFVFVRSAPDLVDELRQYRRRSGLRVSMATLVMLSICREFRRRGVHFGDSVEVVADLRRYLPPGRGTLSNFVSVVRIECVETTTAQQFGDALAAELESLTPLVKAMVSLMISGTWRRRKGQATRRGATGSDPGHMTRPVVISFSDLTKLPLATRVAWARPDDRAVAVMLPLTTSDHLSITLGTLGNGEVQASATFNAGRIDETTVRAVLAAGLSSARWRDTTEGDSG